jgi:hypothetical protein
MPTVAEFAVVVFAHGVVDPALNHDWRGTRAGATPRAALLAYLI